MNHFTQWIVAAIFITGTGFSGAQTESRYPAEVPGPLALGYWNTEHVSVRYWVSPTMGLEAGVGFQFVRHANRFDLQLGLPIVIRRHPTLLLEARPMFELTTIQNDTTNLMFGVGLLAEWFLPGTDNHLALSGGPTFGITIASPAVGSGTTTVGTGAMNLFGWGLHYYF